MASSLLLKLQLTRFDLFINFILPIISLETVQLENKEAKALNSD